MSKQLIIKMMDEKDLEISRLLDEIEDLKDQLKKTKDESERYRLELNRISDDLYDVYSSIVSF